MSDQIQRTLELGEKYPYDGPGKSKNWAHLAARGILADLQDRRGIKHEFNEVDEDIRKEIIQTMASIIKKAYETDNKALNPTQTQAPITQSGK